MLFRSLVAKDDTLEELTRNLDRWNAIRYVMDLDFIDNGSNVNVGKGLTSRPNLVSGLSDPN